jgi:Peptidase inhibitor I78 family
MRGHFMVGVLAAAWLAGACGNKTDGITTPTSIGSSEAAGAPEQAPNRPTPPPQGPPPPTEGSCDASKAQWAVGQRAADNLLERARATAGARTARFLRPNQPVTMEYSGSRLNLGLAEQNVVRSVTCG